MRTFLQHGDILSLTMPRAVTSGSGVKIGLIFGIATATFASGAVGQLKTGGVYSLPKATGNTFAVGDPAYWDDTNYVLTSTATNNTKIGVCVIAALAGDAGVGVRVNANF